MSLNIFRLEDYLSQHEFKAPHLLCCSDAESFSMHEIIAMASDEDRRRWDDLRLGYTEAPGLPELREEIRVSFYPQLKNAANILNFSGAEEGIFSALFALVTPSDHVIVLTPCYQSLEEIPALKGASITRVPLREENQWRINIDDVTQAIKPNTKMIVMNFPHNPTGQVITQNELLALVELCRKHDLWLFSDEVYRGLGNPRDGWASPAAVVYEKALSLGVMSKSFGLAGLRIGWLACQDHETLEKIQQIKHYLSICGSAPAEIISLIALKNKDTLLARNNDIVASNLLMLDDFMKEYENLFSWVKPEGGCVGFINYTGKESIEEFSETLLHEAGVLLLPSSIYGLKSNHFRVGFGRKSMPAALAALGKFLLRK